MNQEDYTAFRKGKLTNVRAMQSMITEVGGGLYTYMVMLKLADRTTESLFYENLRTNIFSIRSALDKEFIDLAKLSEEMRCIYKELETAKTFLIAHKPAEACILQSVTNTACGLIYTIRHFKDEE